jgi:hypothetical protein
MSYSAAIETHHCLNLNVFAWRKRRGPVEMFGTWFRDPGEPMRGPQPCIAMVPAVRHRSRPIAPVIIPTDSAFKYAEDGADKQTAEDAALLAMHFCAPLGLSLDRKNVLWLLSFIRDHVGDLVQMPPRPPVNQYVGADLLITDHETGQTTEAEILDDV